MVMHAPRSSRQPLASPLVPQGKFSCENRHSANHNSHRLPNSYSAQSPRIEHQYMKSMLRPRSMSGDRNLLLSPASMRTEYSLMPGGRTCLRVVQLVSRLHRIGRAHATNSHAEWMPAPGLASSLKLLPFVLSSPAFSSFVFLTCCFIAYLLCKFALLHQPLAYVPTTITLLCNTFFCLDLLQFVSMAEP